MVTMQSSPPAKRLFLSADESEHVDNDKILGINSVSNLLKKIDKVTMQTDIETKVISDGENTFSDLPFAFSSMDDVSISDKNEDKVDDKGKKKKMKKKMEKVKVEKIVPNYFVAVQVSNTEIAENIKKIQDGILLAEKRLKPTLVSPATLHLTLCVLRINNDEELKKASDILETCSDKVKEFLSGKSLELSFEGLGDFRNQVLFAKLKDDENAKLMANVAELVYSCYVDSGLLKQESRDFTPHLTVVKLSKALYLRKLKIKGIQSEWYKDHISSSFGNEVVKSLQLLSMTKPKTSVGYYHSDKEVLFAT